MDWQTLLALCALASLLIAIGGWCVKIERRLTERLTFAQHESICGKRQNEIANVLEEINAKLDQASKERAKSAATIGRLVTRIALVQQKLGLPVNEDAGGET